MYLHISFFFLSRDEPTHPMDFVQRFHPSTALDNSAFFRVVFWQYAETVFDWEVGNDPQTWLRFCVSITTPIGWPPSSRSTCHGCSRFCSDKIVKQSTLKNMDNHKTKHHGADSHDSHPYKSTWSAYRMQNLFFGLRKIWPVKPEQFSISSSFHRNQLTVTTEPKSVVDIIWNLKDNIKTLKLQRNHSRLPDQNRAMMFLARGRKVTMALHGLQTCMRIEKAQRLKGQRKRAHESGNRSMLVVIEGWWLIGAWIGRSQQIQKQSDTEVYHMQKILDLRVILLPHRSRGIFLRMGDYRIAPAESQMVTRLPEW